MRKFMGAAVATAMMLTAIVPTPASAFFYCAPKVPPVVGGSSAAGAGAVGGFLIVVATLDLYDLIRRTTCSGDFLALGGPGFTSPITPGMNVLPPQCVPVVKHHKHHHH